METKKHLIYAFLSFLISAISVSQNIQKTDSLLKVYASATADSNKVNALNNLFAEYRYSDEILANKYVNQAIDFSSKTNLTKGYALALYNKGVFEGEHGNFDSSDKYIKKSLIQYQKINNQAGIAACKMAFGFNMYDKSNFTQALVYFIEAAKLKELINDLKGQSAANIWIGNIYNTGLNMPKLALPYYEKALKIQESVNDENGMAFTYNNLCNVYYFLQKYPESLQNHFKSVELKEKLGNKKGLSSSYDNIGNVYFDLLEFTKAEDYYTKALTIREEFGDKKGMNTSYVNIGNLYFKQKKYKEAIDIHSKALDSAKEINNKEAMKEASNSLSASYEAIGDFKKAFEYSKYSSLIKDSIINSTFTEQISEMQTKYDVEKKDLQLQAQEKQMEKDKAQRYLIISALMFFVLLFSIAIWAFIQKRKNGRLLEIKNDQIETRNALLQNANQEISHQKEQLSEKQKEIVDSINYAKKIQTALLASEEMLLENLVNHFILFKPKDIVSGDFTWATFVPSPSGRVGEGLFYIACCDSTGHGVPGAFMSLLNMGFLSEAIKERNILKPGEIFNYVRDRLIETIGKDEQQDGFDGIIICIDMSMPVRAESRTITYAAANNSPLIIRNKEQIQLSCNKMPVGKGIKTDSFETFTLHYQKNDSLYLFTDGYPDQFGGPKGKKFKYKPLEELLLKNEPLSLEVQKEKLNTTFEDWKGNLEQVDDVCIIGIKL